MGSPEPEDRMSLLRRGSSWFVSSKDRQLGAVGAALMLLAGLVLGFAVSPSENNTDPEPIRRISNIVGWTYFSAWSISFYPQAYLNWKRKSVVGMSFDYQLYNLIGFGAYSAFNVALLWVDPIKAQYRRVNHKGSAVDFNDAFFSLHAVVLTIVTLFQILIYDRGSQKVSTFCKGMTAVFIALSLAYGTACGVADHASGFFSWLSFLYFFSYSKLAVSLIKYIPQAYLNFTRKSTVGWNIWNVLLDFSGGVLSLVQLFLDCVSTRDLSKITGDPVKFGLGFCSMVFDIVFMIQHYILYTDRTDPALTPAPAPKTNTPLLNGALSSSESPSEPPEPRFGRGQRHRSKPWEVEPELSVEGRDLLGGSAEP